MHMHCLNRISLENLKKKPLLEFSTFGIDKKFCIPNGDEKFETNCRLPISKLGRFFCASALAYLL